MNILKLHRAIARGLSRLRLRALRSEECGQELTETSLPVALIALGVIVSTHSVAAGISTELTNISQVVVTGRLPLNQIGGPGK
jgi:hypothetical protein